MWACRRLLRNAVVQLLDVHHNPAALPGVAVRWRLLLKESGSRADEAAAPQLCCSSGGQQLVSDDNGRAFFGDVAVEQDTGRMVSATDPDLPRSATAPEHWLRWHLLSCSTVFLCKPIHHPLLYRTLELIK